MHFEFWILHATCYVLHTTLMKSGFVRKRVESLTLGEKLKKVRGERRVSLADISRSTGIKAAYLERIENGEYDKLPADVYVRGFLRRLAEYLGLREGPVLRQYERERGMLKHLSGESVPADRFLSGAFRKLPRMTVTPQRITALVATLAILGGLGYLYSEYRQFVSDPRLVIESPEEESVNVDGSDISVRGQVDQDARVFINDQEILTDEDGRFEELVQLKQGENRIAVRAINRFDKEAERVITANVRKKEDAGGAALPDSGIHVQLRIANEPTWVLAIVDGEERVSRVLDTGDVVELMPKESCVISAGNGENVYVTIGDEPETTLSAKVGIVQDAKLDLQEKKFILNKSP